MRRSNHENIDVLMLIGLVTGEEEEEGGEGGKSHSKVGTRWVRQSSARSGGSEAMLTQEICRDLRFTFLFLCPPTDPFTFHNTSSLPRKHLTFPFHIVLPKQKTMQ